MDKRLLKPFLTFAIPLTIVFSALIIYIYQTQVEHGIELLEKRENTKVQLLKDNLQDFYDPLVSNVNYLAEREKVKAFLKGSLDSRAELERDLKIISKAVGDYDQIRLLSIDGIELIRVNNYNGKVIVPNDSLLQDKSKRGYVRRILSLQGNRTHVGAIDLNKEEGKVEKPYKPVIRVGKKVFDDDGNPLGIVITNYLMRSYLDSLGKRFNEDSDIMLLTANGSWLSGPERYPKFAHLLGDTLEGGFSSVFPSEWKVIENGAKGAITTDSGLFVFDRLRASIDNRDEEDRMVLVTHVSKKSLERGIGLTIWNLIFGLGVSVAFILWISYVVARSSYRLQLAFDETSKSNEQLKDAQYELKAQQMVLEEKVKERTAELTEAKLFFQGIFDNTFQFVGLLEPNGTLLEANKTALDFGGFTMDQARGLKFWDAPWWSLSEATQNQLKEAIVRSSDGQFIRYDVDVLGGDGQVITIDFSLRPIIKNDVVVYLVAEGRDITDKIALESELKESEKNFRTVFETIDEGIVYQNEKGEITEANSAAVEILGLSIEEMTGRKSVDPRWKAVHEDGTDYPGEEHPPMQVLKTGKEVKDKLMGVFHPGKEAHVWLNVNSYPVFENDSNKPTKVFTTFEDVTEAYLAKKSLVESEGRFRAVFENSSVGIALVNEEGVPDDFNDAFLRLLGYPKETLKNLTFAEFTHTDYLEMDLALYEELLAGKRTSYRIEKKYIRHDGTEIWADLFVSSIKDAEDQHKYALALVLDITPQKMARQEIETLNKSLELKVAERTKDLTEANKELESFSYSVSHDLRAPLRAVTSFAQILQEDYYELLDEEGKDTLNIIRDNGRYMGQLIDDLLQFSRLGRQKLNAVQIDIQELTNEVLQGLQQSIDTSQYEIDIQNLPKANGDRDLMKQVMVNLLSNAIKYSSKSDSPKVTIGSMENEGKTTYFVKDNGVGFNMEYADKLFGVFQRLHSHDEFEGTGVGLAIVERIIKRHGGRVWAEAELNNGATFLFQLN